MRVMFRPFHVDTGSPCRVPAIGMARPGGAELPPEASGPSPSGHPCLSGSQRKGAALEANWCEEGCGAHSPTLEAGASSPPPQSLRCSSRPQPRLCSSECSCGFVTQGRTVSRPSGHQPSKRWKAARSGARASCKRLRSRNGTLATLTWHSPWLLLQTVGRHQ